MRKIGIAAVFAALATVASAAEAATIANCGAPSGWAYYVKGGPVGEGDAGWGKSQITGGKTTLSFTTAGQFDILFVDATGAISSATAEGATVRPIRYGADEITVTISYPGAAFEVYSYVRDGDGKAQLLTLQSRGRSTAFTNATVMVAPCDLLDLETLDAMVSAGAAAASASAATDAAVAATEEAAAAAEAAIPRK